MIKSICPLPTPKIYYLFEKQSNRETERDRHLPSAGSLFKQLQWPDLGQVKARSLDLHLALSPGGQGTTHLGHVWIAFTSILAGSWIKSWTAKTWGGTYKGCQHCRLQIYWLSHNAGPAESSYCEVVGFHCKRLLNYIILDGNSLIQLQNFWDGGIKFLPQKFIFMLWLFVAYVHYLNSSGKYFHFFQLFP